MLDLKQPKMSTTTINFITHLIGGPSDFAIGWIIILVSSLITIAIALVGLIQWIVKKLNKKNIYLQKTQQLAIGMDIRNFENILGNPAFINKLDDELSGYKEFLFSNPYFYAQAITNLDQQVVLFSITTKRNNFNPKFQIGGGGDSGPSIILGRTSFLDIGNDPKKVFKHYDHGGIVFYSEIFYFGRPGHYLEYAFSLNLNGQPAIFDYIPSSFSDFERIMDDSKELSKFRANTSINTFTIINGIDDYKIENLILGPRTGQVWNLNQ